MKYNPYFKNEYSLHVDCQINGSDKIDFCLDTSSPYTLLSRETAEMLAMQGFLSREEANLCLGKYEYIPVGRNIAYNCLSIDIEELTLGDIILPYPFAFVYDDYGHDNILSISEFEHEGELNITSEFLELEDGRKAPLHLFDGNIPEGLYETACQYYLKSIKEYVENCDEPAPINEISPIIGDLTKLIDKCKILVYQQEFEKVIPIIKELENLIVFHDTYFYQYEFNYGYYISAYSYTFLAEAYYGLNKISDALAYGRKAIAFYSDDNVIGNQLRYICRYADLALRTPEYQKPTPSKIKDVGDTIKEKCLEKVIVVDNIHSNGKKLKAYIGFEDYSEAFAFATTYHKRLEVIERRGNDDCWHRTSKLGSENLGSNYLSLGNYHAATTDWEVDEFAEKIIAESREEPDKTQEIRKRQKELKSVINAREQIYYEFLFNKDTLEWDSESELRNNTHLNWHGQEVALAVFDVQKSLSRKYLKDVLGCCKIPCAGGTMPEDYYPISTQFIDNLDFFNPEDDGTGRLSMGNFVVYNKWGLPGLACRASYDKGKTWRWENLTYGYPNDTYPHSYDYPDRNNDIDIIYWSLNIGDFDQGFRDCQPI